MLRLEAEMKKQCPFHPVIDKRSAKLAEEKRGATSATSPNTYDRLYPEPPETEKRPDGSIIRVIGTGRVSEELRAAEKVGSDR